MKTKRSALPSAAWGARSRKSPPRWASGHTDAAPFAAGANYSNWELSADRALASRRTITQAGIAPGRITQVVGKANTEPLNTADPFLPENRRISFVLLRTAPVLPPNLR